MVTEHCSRQRIVLITECNTSSSTVKDNPSRKASNYAARTKAATSLNWARQTKINSPPCDLVQQPRPTPATSQWREATELVFSQLGVQHKPERGLESATHWYCGHDQNSSINVIQHIYQNPFGAFTRVLKHQASSVIPIRPTNTQIKHKKELSAIRNSGIHKISAH